MEIRMLSGFELQWAVQTAREIYDRSMRPYINNEAEAEQFYSYVNVENLGREMNQGRLFLWGIFDRGLMCAVSAMQGNGHVSILLIRPEYQQLELDKRLTKVMKRYATDTLGIGEVQYPTKKVSNKVVLAITAAVLLFTTALYTGVTIHHMATDGLITNQAYEERMKEPEQGK